MSELTPNLGLFKYDPTVDGKEVFSIETALNDNWDILDTKACSPETVVDGTTWYRRFTDGWKEQGGLVSLTETELDWEQPTISQNGSPGGSSIAVYWTGQGQTYTTEPYQGFDKNNQTAFRMGYNGNRVILYTPYGIKVSSVYIDMSGNGNNEYCTSSYLEGSVDGNTWDILSSMGNQGLYITGNVSESARKFYQYHCIRVGSCANTSQQSSFREITFTAKYKSNVANSITFPLSFTNTNYSYTFACQDAGGMNAYISNKTVTGMSLSNSTSGSASWTACGY